MWLFNFLMRGGAVDIFAGGVCGIGEGFCAAFNQTFQRFMGLIYKVLGLFADLMHVAFYIFAGVDMKAGKGAESGIFDIEITSTGSRKNILDYFVFNESVMKAYWILAGIGLLLIVVFTIYKIVKQDYFEKAGPRSKGPIFRNVAISAISFLLVIPIFYITIHVSSLLAVAVMDAMGMDSSVFAGAQVFQLSWSDKGALMRRVNAYLTDYEAKNYPKLGTFVTDANHFSWMYALDTDTMFVTMSEPKYINYSPQLMEALNLGEEVSFDGGVLVRKADGSFENGSTAVFYWYVYLVGVVITIKTLYKLLLAMLQRIFKLLGLFIVAPSPISQYVLDEGQKFKNWLSNTIEQGLRIVVATMCFSIFLMVLGLVGDINFITPLRNAVPGGSVDAGVNVTANMLSFNPEFSHISMLASAGGGDAAGAIEGGANPPEATMSGFYQLANAFMQILVLIGAGGAVVDLDALITPLIHGKGSSLDAGQTGKAADGLVQATKGVAAAGVSAITSGIGSIPDLIKSGNDGNRSGREQADKEQEENEKTPPPGGDGGPGGSGGGNSPGGGPNTDSNDNEQTNTPEEENVPNPDEDGGDGSGDGSGGPAPGDESGDGSEDEEATSPEEGDVPNPDGEGGDGDGSGDEEAASPKEGDASNPSEENKSDNSSGNGDSGNSDSSSRPVPHVGKSDKVSERVKQNQAERKSKLGRRIARGAGKVAVAPFKAAYKGFKVAKTVGKYLGINAMLKAATKSIATATFGKETVGAFMEARKDTKAAIEKDKKALFAAGQKHGYKQERKEQAAAAREIAEEKRQRALATATTVTEAVEAESTAAEEVNAATDEVFEAQEEAASASANIDNVDINAITAEESVPNEGVKVSKAREGAMAQNAKMSKKNERMLSAAGVATYDELKNLHASESAELSALKSKDSKKLTKEEKSRIKELDGETGLVATHAYYVKSIKGTRGKMTTNNTIINGASATARDKLVTSQNNIIEKAGLSKGAGLNDLITLQATHQHAKKEIQQRISKGTASEKDHKELAKVNKMLAADEKNIEAYKKNDADIQRLDSVVKSNSDRTAFIQENEQSIRDTVSGRGNKLAKFGVTADMSHADAIKKVEEAKANKVSGAQDALDNLNAINEKIYNSSGAKKARAANERVAEAKDKQAKAKEKHKNASNATNVARSELKASMQAFDNSVQMVNKIDKTTAAHAGSKTKLRYTGESDKDGSLVKSKVVEQNPRAVEKAERRLMKKNAKKDKAFNEANARGSAILDNVANSQATEVNVYANYNAWSKDRTKRNDQNLAAAGDSYIEELRKDDTKVTAMSDIGQYVTDDGNIDEDKIAQHLNAVNKPTKKKPFNDAYNFEHSRIRSELQDAMVAAQGSTNGALENHANVSQNSSAFKKMLKECSSDVESADGNSTSSVYDLDALQSYDKSKLSAADKTAVDKYIADTKKEFVTEARKPGRTTDMTVGEYSSRFEHDDKGIYRNINANQIKSPTQSTLEKFQNPDYQDSLDKHASVEKSLEAGKKFMKANQGLQNSETEKMERCTNEYKSVTNQLGQLDNVISSNGANLSPQAIQIIASTLGVEGRYVNSSNAVEYATKAKEVKQQEQIALMKEAEGHSRTSEELKSELASMFNTITKSVDGNNNNAPTNNTTNITNVNNNNVSNGDSSASPYWFDQNGNGRESKEDGSISMFDRMQLEGIKHMENMLEQMKVEQRSMANQVDAIEKEVEELTED